MAFDDPGDWEPVGGPATTPQPSTIDDWEPITKLGVGDYAKAGAQRLVAGARDTLGSGLQGVAEATAVLPEEQRAQQIRAPSQRAASMVRPAMPWSQALEQANEEAAAGGLDMTSNDPRESLAYRAGSAIKGVGKEALTPGPAGEGLFGDVAGAVGSTVGGVGLSLIPGVGPLAAAGTFIGAGQQEAAENARNAGASPAQIKEAAQQGTVPGATDLVDVALAKALPFGTGRLTTRILKGALEGGIVEATQEGIQQFMQNMIARRIYDPTKDLWDQVGYSALVAALAGGGMGGAISIPKGKEAPTTGGSNILGITPAEAAVRTPTPQAPQAPIVPKDELPPFMGGPPLTPEEINGLQVEREVRRQEIQSMDLASPEFAHAVARLQDISLQLKTAEEQASGAIPGDATVPIIQSGASNDNKNIGSQRTLQKQRSLEAMSDKEFADYQASREEDFIANGGSPPAAPATTPTSNIVPLPTPAPAAVPSVTTLSQPSITVKWNNDTNEFQAIAPDGKIVGTLLDAFPEGKGAKPAFTAGVSVDPAWQRKGVATALYEKFAARHQDNIVPAGNTTPEAWEFWFARHPEKVTAFFQNEAKNLVADTKTGEFPPSYAIDAINNGYSHPRAVALAKAAYDAELTKPQTIKAESNVVPFPTPAPAAAPGPSSPVAPEEPAAPASPSKDLHALTRRRLNAFDDLAQAARSGNLDGVRQAKAVLAQIEQEWSAATAPNEPSNDPNAPQREAFHGSPARHSGFHAEYLRTGEGNMVKGHGFYFAEARGVSEEYTRLKDAQKIADLFVKRAEGDRVVAVRQLRDTLGRAPEAMQRDYQSALDILEGREPQNTLYQVNIAAEREHLLDFDAPWGQQSAYVRAALTALRESSEFKAKDKTGTSWRGQTGEAIYNEISNTLARDSHHVPKPDGDALASALLLAHGIPGSMFLDQFSRRGLTKEQLQKQLDAAYTEAAARMKYPAYEKSGAAIGRHIADLERQVREAPERLTRNFVIFDPKRVQILTRNGEPLVGAQVIQPEGAIRSAASDRGLKPLQPGESATGFPPLQGPAAPKTVEQTAQTAVHYGNLHLAVYDEATKEVHVSRPVSLTKEIPQNLVPADNVILHDDTIIEFAPGNQKMFSEIGQEKFGKRFDEYNYGVGEVFKGLRERVAALMPGYKGILNEAVGVSFGFGYRNQGIPVLGTPHGGGWHGVSFKKFPFSGYFVNPFLAHFSATPEEVATSIMTTMVHEFAHHVERRETVGHGPFAHEMQAIQIKLATDPSRAYERLKNALTQHVRDHWDVYTEMERIPHVHDVRPLSSSSLWGVSPQSAGNASIPRNNGGLGLGGGGRARGNSVIHAGAANSGPVANDAGVSVSYPGYSTTRELGVDANQRGLAASGASAAVPAVPIQPSTAGIRSGLQRLFAGRGVAAGAGQPPGSAQGSGGGNIGGLPPIVAGAAAQADSMNWIWKWWYGLDQAADNNPNFAPIVRYREVTQQMHLEESNVHDMGLRVAKQWSRLTPVQNKALIDVYHDITQLAYLTPQEKANGVVRLPTPQEEAAIFATHKLGNKGQQVYRAANASFNAILAALEKNARDDVVRNVTDPKRFAAEMKKITDQVTAIKSKPFFPYSRFGSHYVKVEDAAGQLVTMETFERRGILPARHFQKQRARELRRQYPGFNVVEDKFPAEVDPLSGMPSLMLQSMQGQLTMTPAQMKAAQLLQMTSARYFASRFKKGPIPAYSMDFLRSYSSFIFHSGRYYAHTKYAWQLRGNIDLARKVRENKATALADYMNDHLQNTVLDARGDFGKLKGFIFLYGLGYSPAAATANMTQLPFIVLPFFNAKFGMTKGAPALLRAMTQEENFYKRGAYAGQPDFVSRAMEYGIQTGRITEAQAPELAGLSIANNLNSSVLGNRAQRGWKAFFEKSSWMFEMAEQGIRRVTYRAALDLALKNPQSKATQEALKLHPDEFRQLQAKFSPAEAAALVTANYMTETPNFIYAKWARPRLFRSPVASVILVFQKYMQSLLTLMKTHSTDFLPQYLLINMFVYGLAGFPGSDDFKDILKALAAKMFGKHFNLEEKTRQYVLDISGGKIEPDLILHGIARKGWGLPALIDLMGEKPGRGLAKDFQHSQNIPFPQLDRSRTGASRILPFDIGKVLNPQDPNAAIGEQGARASGAVFSVGFNFYKFIEDEHHPGFDDRKQWEKIFPRFLKDASRGYRVFEEGRERGAKGGPGSASTVVPYDVHDTEQMMEAVAMGLGYQPTRQSMKWDQVLDSTESEKYYHSKRVGLMEQFAETRALQNTKAQADVVESIKTYNKELPDWAKGQAISADQLRESVTARAVAKNARESGTPAKASDVGIARHIQGLHPGAIVDVRPVR